MPLDFLSKFLAILGIANKDHVANSARIDRNRITPLFDSASDASQSSQSLGQGDSATIR